MKDDRIPIVTVKDNAIEKSIHDEGLSSYEVYTQRDIATMGYTYIFVKHDEPVGQCKVLKTVYPPDSEQITVNIEMLSENERRLHLLRLARVYDKVKGAPKPDSVVAADYDEALRYLKEYRPALPTKYYEANVLPASVVEAAILAIENQHKNFEDRERMQKTLDDIKVLCTRLKAVYSMKTDYGQGMLVCGNMVLNVITGVKVKEE